MQRELVHSSNINSIGYENGILEVEFNKGDIYQYYGVPEEVFENLFKSESIGSYVSKYIKKQFAYKLVNPKEK